MKNVFLIIEKKYDNSKDVFVKRVLEDNDIFVFERTTNMDDALELPTSEVANAVIKSATFTSRFGFTNIVVRPKKTK